MQAVDAADFAEHGAGELHAVGHRGGLRQVEQGACEHRVLDAQVDAANEVRRVFALGQPARCRAGCALVREHEDRAAARASGLMKASAWIETKRSA